FTISIDRQRYITNSSNKYKLYYNALRNKIKFYKIEPAHTYNINKKGFIIRAISKQKRIFSKR
ncbi:hypothetical protein BU23DRAFT_397950, partial [Bimuria novae-zelandiae CBS 107.79]